jgi:hypothetical protein
MFEAFRIMLPEEIMDLGGPSGKVMQELWRGDSSRGHLKNASMIE